MSTTDSYKKRKHVFDLDDKTKTKFFVEKDLTNLDLSNLDLTDINVNFSTDTYYFCKTNLRSSNLSTLNLEKIDFRRSLFTDANLSNCNLTDANLEYSNLTEVNLSKANLTQANLSNTSLIRADLTEADLTGADLSGSNLTGSSLLLANLDNCNFKNTQITGVDFNLTNFGNCNIHEAKYFTTKDKEIKLAKSLLKDLITNRWNLDMHHWHLEDNDNNGCGTSHCIAGYICPDIEIPAIEASKLAPTLSIWFYNTHYTKKDVLKVLEQVATGNVSIFDKNSLSEYFQYIKKKN